MSFVLFSDLIISEIITSIPNSIMADPCSMPNPRDKGTLYFKGKDIDVFLSKFESYADRARLTEFWRCEFLRLYFSKKERRVLDVLEGYRCHSWDQLKEELWSLYASSCASGSISLYAKPNEPKQDREARNKFMVYGLDDNSASESQSYVASELRSSVGQCDMCGESPHAIVECRETRFLMLLGICELDRDGHVVMRDGSALPPAEGEGRSAQVIRE